MASLINAFGINPNLISSILFIGLLSIISLFVFYKFFTPSKV